MLGRAIMNVVLFLYLVLKRTALFFIHRLQQKQKQTKVNKSLPSQYTEWKELHSLEGTWAGFEKKLFESKSLIGMILGARGSGKTGFGMALLENIAAKTKKSVFALGFHPKDLPLWITPIHDISEVENNAVVLVDEGAIQYSSRKSMTDANKVLSDLLFISRHRDLTILFIAQNSSTIEINTLRQADFLVLKPSSLLQKDFERKKIKDIYEEMAPFFKKYADQTGLTYIYSDWYRGFVSNPLPTFWNTNISKSYRAGDPAKDI